MRQKLIIKTLPLVYILVNGLWSSGALADWNTRHGYGGFPPVDIEQKIQDEMNRSRLPDPPVPESQNNSVSNKPENQPLNPRSALNYSGQHYPPSASSANSGFQRAPARGSQPPGNQFSGNQFRGNQPRGNPSWGNRGSGFTAPWDNNASSFSGPWNNRGSGFSAPWGGNGSNFNMPFGNNGSGFSSPWNNNGSGFSMPWGNNGWGNNNRSNRGGW